MRRFVESDITALLFTAVIAILVLSVLLDFGLDFIIAAGLALGVEFGLIRYRRVILTRYEQLDAESESR